MRWQAEILVSHKKAEVVIVAQGANFGGWVLYARNGKLKYIYNYLGMETYFIEADTLLTPGLHQIRMEFKYDGRGLGKGGVVSLFIDNQKVAEGRIDNTHTAIFSADFTAMVGDKVGAPICSDLQVGHNRFNGKVNWVRIELGEDDFGHLISQEEKFRIAMSIQ